MRINKIDYKKEIINDIKSLSGSRSPYDIFYDWVEAVALAIANGTTYRHDEIWQKREDKYLKIVNSYDDKGTKICDMYAKLVKAYDNEIGDILGEIYMESGSGNKATGQFFTPFHISRMMARLVLADKDLNEPIKFTEPSCGAGGMIIAMAAELKIMGINYQSIMDVVARDLDWKAVYMCYIQLSMLGIKAVVVQGNALTEPYTGRDYPKERVFYTPAKVWRLY